MANCCHTHVHEKTARSDEEKARLVNRLNRIEGQLRGIRKMVESDAYCTDILTQSSAAAAAFASFRRELLAEHIKGCVVRDIKNGEYEIVDELIDMLEKLMK